MNDFLTSNPVTAALLWIFNQVSSDPEIIRKAITLAVIVAVLRIILFIAGTVQTSRRKKWREQYERGYSSMQRAEGFIRAGKRCEFDNGISRCRNAAEHADHFYPWSKGGATSMQNLVAACASHNLSKSAKMPSPSLKYRIESRRRSYFPKRANLTAGEWSMRHNASAPAATVEFSQYGD